MRSTNQGWRFPVYFSIDRQCLQSPDKPALFSLTLSCFLCPSLSSSAYLLLSRTTPNILLTATTESKVHFPQLNFTPFVTAPLTEALSYASDSWSEQKHNQTSHLPPDPDSHTVRAVLNAEPLNFVFFFSLCFWNRSGKPLFFSCFVCRRAGKRER